MRPMITGYGAESVEHGGSQGQEVIWGRWEDWKYRELEQFGGQNEGLMTYYR